MKRCVVTIEGYRARAAILVHVVVCPVPSTVRPQSSRYLSCKFYSQVQLRYQYEFLISLETHGHINQPAPQPIISITSQNERRLLYMSYYRDIPIRFYFPFLGPTIHIPAGFLITVVQAHLDVNVGEGLVIMWSGNFHKTIGERYLSIYWMYQGTPYDQNNKNATNKCSLLWHVIEAID